MADDCLFCKIAAGEIPSTQVYSDDDFYAFLDIQPAAPKHILVIPRRHVAHISDLTAADADLAGRLILTANKVAAQEGMQETGFRVVINCGEGAGQLVFHLHLHLLGGRVMGWPPG